MNNRADISGWVLIYIIDDQWRLDLIRQILDSNDIACVVIDKKDSSFHFGNAEIYVKHQDAERAVELIKDIEN